MVSFLSLAINLGVPQHTCTTMFASQKNNQSGNAVKSTESWYARDYLLLLGLFLGGCLGLLKFDKFTFTDSKAAKDARFQNAGCMTSSRRFYKHVLGSIYQRFKLAMARQAPDSDS